MSGDWIYLNGEFVSKPDAKVFALDVGLLYGDGLFETWRSYGGRFFAFDRHARRLFAGLEVLGFSIPETAEELESAAREIVQRNGGGDAAVRLTVTRGAVDNPFDPASSPAPTRIIHTRPMRPFAAERGVAAMILTEPFAPLLGGLKSLNHLPYILAGRKARDAGAFEALLADGEGRIVEGSSSNVFAVFENEVWTPPLSSGALPGVTREIALEILRNENLPVREETILAKDLPAVREVFLTNSVIEILPVTTLDGRAISGGLPGPVSVMMLRKYRERVEKSLFSFR